MGFQARRSIKIAPGVRLNVSMKSINAVIAQSSALLPQTRNEVQRLLRM